MYSCGPTVYADQHIGNMRTYVFPDTLKRALRWKGYQVRHVINITDVGHLTSDADEGEDKLELAAQHQRRDAWEIAEHYTRAFHTDLVRLRVLEPDVWCKATDHVPQMIRFARFLDSNRACYLLPSGLYFDTSRDEHYGTLARLDIGGQRPGARVDVVDDKRNPSDFAVWRTSKTSDHRQMEWDSPWGRGAPGWHLECSVMSMEYLGSHFDIYTGGVDHIPVHHTNEIAQSEAYLADGKPWVQWWLHGEFINLDGAKIAKSSAGGILVSDLIERGFHPLVYRYLILQAHYQSQVEFSWTAMESARTGFRRLLDRFASARRAPQAGLGLAAQAHLDAFDRGISEDLNTPQALAAVVAASRDSTVPLGELVTLAVVFDALLGLGLADLEPEDLDRKRFELEVPEDEIEELVAERNRARAAKDFVSSDRLRDRLATLGVIVEDRAGVDSTWRWA